MRRAAKTTSTVFCVLMLTFCAASTGSAQRSLTKAQARRFVRNLPAIDKVELVQYNMAEDPRDRRIAKSIFVEHAEAVKIAALWRTQTHAPDRSACHNPSYGVRFFVKEKELFYASVCWSCNNILFFNPDFQGGLHFDGDDKKGQQLLEFFQEAFSETKRTKSSKSLSFHSGKRVR
jgi:hypothetical protein